MTADFGEALAAGAQELGRGSSLLDSINVYPVADGDTGENLRLSLAPLLCASEEGLALRRRLLLAARGNSGNIAARFLGELVKTPTLEALRPAVDRGCRLARGAVAEPREGTMLSVLDALGRELSGRSLLVASGDHLPEPTAGEPPGEGAEELVGLLGELAEAVRLTHQQLPILSEAGVLDAGALGMFIFLERFLLRLLRLDPLLPTIPQRFGGLLRIRPGFGGRQQEGFCVDAVVRSGDMASLDSLGGLGSSTVVHSHEGLLKIHLHTASPEDVRDALGAAGDLVSFVADDLGVQTRRFAAAVVDEPIHLVTDAAGSFTADDALELGVTLLSSYIQCDGRSLPESEMVAERLYEAMRAGARVSTSQASLQERHEVFDRLLGDHQRVLYLTVGSAFSGIYEVAARWRDGQPEPHRFLVLDSGAASGKLGVVVRATAELARRLAGGDPEGSARAVVAFAREALGRADELIFLDRLKYLAAGGRLSKTASFFGEALRLKPIVTPAADGARKVGTVRSRKDQLAFAWRRLGELPPATGHYLVLLQHTDNEAWLREEVAPRVLERLPGARVLLRPMSLTSGAHMGPGTWALAYLALDWKPQAADEPGSGYAPDDAPPGEP